MSLLIAGCTVWAESRNRLSDRGAGCDSEGPTKGFVRTSLPHQALGPRQAHCRYTNRTSELKY